MLLLFAGSSASAQPRPVTAEEAMEVHKRTFSAVPKQECGDAAGQEEIVVCGNRNNERYRVTVPPAPGQRVRGEPLSTLEGIKPETCTNIGQTRGCPYVDFYGIGLMIAKKVITKVIEESGE